MEGWIDAAAAAERLGVKPATLYAYVSRGVLRRQRDATGRRSLFSSVEVEELARRGRPRHRPGPAELSITSELTALGADRPYYRGRDALGLAGSTGFEAVAEWLWTGADPPPSAAPWRSMPEAVAVARAAQSGLPAGVLPIDRLQIIAAALAAADPGRFLLDAPSVLETGRALISGLVDALPVLAPGDPVGSLARRLWARLAPQAPPPLLLAALEAALVLLADHELAASTLAARVAASVRADPYAVITTGLGVLSGPMHGGASLGVERLLAETRSPADAPAVVAGHLRRGERVPGFGHPVYQGGDARGTVLLELVRAAGPDHPRLAAADALVAACATRRLPKLNIDLALGTLTSVAGMVTGAGEAVFAVARSAGWLAHALEEYERRTPLRPRAGYVGPAIPS